MTFLERFNIKVRVFLLPVARELLHLSQFLETCTIKTKLKATALFTATKHPKTSSWRTNYRRCLKTISSNCSPVKMYWGLGEGESIGHTSLTTYPTLDSTFMYADQAGLW